MTIEKIHEQLKVNIWKSISQSGISMNTIPVEEQNKFVDHLADNLLVTLNGMLDDISPTGKVAGIKFTG